MGFSLVQRPRPSAWGLTDSGPNNPRGREESPLPPTHRVWYQSGQIFTCNSQAAGTISAAEGPDRMPTAPNPTPTTKMAPKPKSLGAREHDIEFVFIGRLQQSEALSSDSAFAPKTFRKSTSISNYAPRWWPQPNSGSPDSGLSKRSATRTESNKRKPRGLSTASSRGRDPGVYKTILPPLRRCVNPYFMPKLDSRSHESGVL